MKILISTIILSIFSIISINAQKLENSTLWKIEGNGLEKPSYIFGTIHITCDATLQDDVKKALDETSQVVLEIDMDDPTMQTKMMGGMYMKEGQKISDLVSKEDYAIIDSLITNEVGMPLKMVENIKPFFLIAMLYPKMLECPMQSFEQEIMNVAIAQKEEINGLETIEDQMNVFDEIPYEDQVADLLKTAKDNLKNDRETFQKMLNVYKDENIEALIAMINDDEASSVNKHQDKLLINRNKNWIPKISEYSKEQATFFGVGAGHLAGEFGVINLLREAGYIVNAVME